MGFVFVRFKPSGQPSVRQTMAPFEAEAAPYDVPAMVPAYRGHWKSETPVNWKAVRDVDNAGYHVPMAHPGLQDLYGHRYFDETPAAGAHRSLGHFIYGEHTSAPTIQ